MLPLSISKIGELTCSWAQKAQLKCYYQLSHQSTNNWAKESAIKSNDLISLYLTDNQTHGRGRNQNKWINANSGTCLLSLWCFKTSKIISAQSTPFFGLAVFNSLNSTWTNVPWNLKFPNDVYINDKKVCGILSENLIIGDESWLIIGIGLNVISHPSILNEATHLEKHIEKFEVQDWFYFLDRLLLELSLTVGSLMTTSLKQQKQNLITTLNKQQFKEELFINFDESGYITTNKRKFHYTEF